MYLRFAEGRCYGHVYFQHYRRTEENAPKEPEPMRRGAACFQLRAQKARRTRLLCLPLAYPKTETPAIDATDAATIAESPAIDVDAAAETPLADEDSAVSTEASTADATDAVTTAESPAVDVDTTTAETPLTDEDTTKTEAQIAAPIAATSVESTQEAEPAVDGIPGDLRQEIKSVLSYMDQLLENLPEEKIAEFAQSDQFTTYKKLFKELGLA